MNAVEIEKVLSLSEVASKWPRRVTDQIILFAPKITLDKLIKLIQQLSQLQPAELEHFDVANVLPSLKTNESANFEKRLTNLENSLAGIMEVLESLKSQPVIRKLGSVQFGGSDVGRREAIEQFKTMSDFTNILANWWHVATAEQLTTENLIRSIVHAASEFTGTRVPNDVNIVMCDTLNVEAQANGRIQISIPTLMVTFDETITLGELIGKTYPLITLLCNKFAGKTILELSRPLNQ